MESVQDGSRPALLQSESAFIGEQVCVVVVVGVCGVWCVVYVCVVCGVCVCIMCNVCVCVCVWVICSIMCWSVWQCVYVFMSA